MVRTVEKRKRQKVLLIIEEAIFRKINYRLWVESV